MENGDMILLALIMQTVVIVHRAEVTVMTGEPRHSVAYWNRKMKRDEDAFLKYNPDANVCMHFAGQKDHAGCHDSYMWLSMYNPAYLKQHPEIKPVTDTDWSVSGMTKPGSLDPDPAKEAELEQMRHMSQADIKAKIDAELEEGRDKIARCGYKPDCQ
jgi:hypothetical protein